MQTRLVFPDFASSCMILSEVESIFGVFFVCWITRGARSVDWEIRERSAVNEPFASVAENSIGCSRELFGGRKAEGPILGYYRMPFTAV